MHRLSASFVFCYHGCRKDVAEDLIAGADFEPSDNDYDWLGPGIYFWEANPRRGVQFLEEKSRRHQSEANDDGSVVGAIVDLGLCLDLTETVSIELLKSAYEIFAVATYWAGHALPRNTDDVMRRNLDCAVIRFLHRILGIAGAPPIQSVKGVFTEGDPIYPGAGILEKTHIQIAVCDPSCIKGVFRVRPRDLN